MRRPGLLPRPLHHPLEDVVTASHSSSYDTAVQFDFRGYGVPTLIPVVKKELDEEERRLKPPGVGEPE